jgi:hypothetical protein
MTVRPLDLLDLPTLVRYRRSLLSLDSARMLTRGNPFGPVALLSYLNPRRFSYTAIASENGHSLMGQVTLIESEASARLTFLAPAEEAEAEVIPLVEALATQAGAWGAFHLLAEVDEGAPAMRPLRQAGFSMFAWQRIWKMAVPKTEGKSVVWRPVESLDWPAVQSLHNQIIPALLQPIEILPKQAEGLICRSGQDLQAYARVISGPAGVWLQPFVPPDCECMPQLSALVSAFGRATRRPVYVCVRSYQAWLESVLEDMGGQVGPQQAVLVKHLAKLQKSEQVVNSMEKVLVKPAAPVARTATSEDFPSKK